MATTLYVWYPYVLKDSLIGGLFAKDVGHCSLQVNSTAYMSFVPDGSVKKKTINKYVPSKNKKNLDEDINTIIDEVNNQKIKRGDPQKKGIVITFDNLDEEAMIKYWDKIKHKKYHPLNNNCSSVIAEIIREGMIKKWQKASFLEKFKPLKMYYPNNWFTTLSSVSHAIAGDTFFWEPKNVIEFAKTVKTITK